MACVIVEWTPAAGGERQCLRIARIAEKDHYNIVLAVADNQWRGAVKDELILRHFMNLILQFCSASLHESRRPVSLRFGERDLSGVTIDGMTFYSPPRDFAS